MAKRTTPTRFLLCVKNDVYLASLEVRKIYQAVADADAEKHRLVRVIDESGEDYLYPQKLFIPLELPLAAKKVFAVA